MSNDTGRPFCSVSNMTTVWYTIAGFRGTALGELQKGHPVSSPASIELGNAAEVAAVGYRVPHCVIVSVSLTLSQIVTGGKCKVSGH
jgi:hypothetical protein